MEQKIATAKPNEKYVHYINLKRITIEAWRINNQIRFYEISNNYKRSLNQQLVKSLFPVGKRTTDQPFRKKENLLFYNVLYKK